MRPALADDAVLCTDGSGMLAKVANDLGIGHHAVNTLRREHTRGAWHIQNVNAYHCRFKQWMGCFNGVATATCPTTSAGSERWTALHNPAPSSRHCWLWPSTAETARS